MVARGRVQGVFFRDGLRSRAAEHDVAGWVVNRSDGAVEAVLEGAPDAVDALVGFCREGPGDARVEDVEVAEEPAEGLHGFEVR